MPEINRVPFRYEPIGGDLFLDGFRSTFYTERLDDVKRTLQYMCRTSDVTSEVEGELLFVRGRGEPPKLRDFRYADHRDRAEAGEPFADDGPVTLWSA